MIFRKNQTTDSLHTFGLKQTTSFYVEVKDLDELKLAVTFAQSRRIPFKVVGEGSNLLFLDDYEGLLIANRMLGREIVSEDGQSIRLRIQAGESWHDLVNYTVINKWYGLENLALIPGKVGACPIQNIGAYGAEVKDVLCAVTYFDPLTSEVTTLDGKDCNFGYRDSIFKHKLKHVVIIDVEFILDKTGTKLHYEYGGLEDYLMRHQLEKTPESIFKAVVAIRQSKLPDPKEVGNAGSFFKNPIVDVKVAESLRAQYEQMPLFPAGRFKKLSAAWLIQEAGLKGQSFGRAQVYPNHALVLTNKGGALGQDVKDAIESITSEVRKKFGVTLEVEPEIVS